MIGFTALGGSGGALALAAANRVYMLENAVYSVISPEGCAGILWKDAGRAPDAAQALHITADDMKGYGIVEDIVTENFDDFPAMCGELGALLARDLRVLKEMTPQQLCSDRYARFRSFGIFREKT